MASKLLAMASSLAAMASNLEAMASDLDIAHHSLARFFRRQVCACAYFCRLHSFHSALGDSVLPVFYTSRMRRL